MSNAKEIILIGAGGHAKVLREIACANGYIISGYNDPALSSFFTVPRFSDSECENILKQGAHFFMGIGGQTVESLKHRYHLFKKYSSLARSPKLVHAKASVCGDAKIHEGVLVAAGTIVQVAAEIGAGSIINSGAIVEHDGVIGKGGACCAGSHYSRQRRNRRLFHDRECP